MDGGRLADDDMAMLEIGIGVDQCPFTHRPHGIDGRRREERDDGIDQEVLPRTAWTADEHVDRPGRDATRQRQVEQFRVVQVAGVATGADGRSEVSQQGRVGKQGLGLLNRFRVCRLRRLLYGTGNRGD